MNWDNLEIDDWIDLEREFVFYVERYDENGFINSVGFDSIRAAKQMMEYIKMHEKSIKQLHIIAVKKDKESVLEYVGLGEYWADVDSWIRKEVKKIMIKKLPDYIQMFSEYKNKLEKKERPLTIVIQIMEHYVRLNNNEPGYDILIDSLRDIPFELLRYSADDEEIHLSLKYYVEDV